MPHHNHANHMHLHARQGPWGQFTSAAGSIWNDIFPTGKAGSSGTRTHSSDTGDSSGPSTSYETVYTTQTPEGWAGGALTTLAPATEAAANAASTAAQTTTTSATAQQTLQTAPAQSTSTLPSVISSSSLSSSPKTLVVAETTSTPSLDHLSPTKTASADSTTDAASHSSGPSTGAKAGIAFGVLGAVFVVFVALYFLFTRRRRQVEEQRRVDDDEKRNGPFADSNAIGGTSSGPTRAPRLSLRPVTQFLPNLGNQTHPDGRPIPMTTSPTRNANRAVTGGNSMAPPGTSLSARSANPFGNDAAEMYVPTPEETSRAANPVSPVEDVVGAAVTTNSPPRTSPAAAASIATMAAGAAVGLARKTSLRRDRGPRPLDLTTPPSLSAVPPSPAGTEFSMHSVAPGQSPGPSASAAAIAAAGGPAQSAVHRVQLDFKPTLEDEMGLRAGQLVRLLHEYDDGWALCILLDRSQQGVVPRTCLSTRPVKPRTPPGGGRPGLPVNPQSGLAGYPAANRSPGAAPAPRGGPPYPRPGSAQSGRQSPSGRPPMGFQHGGRPQSPAGMRPMSPSGRPPMASPRGGRSQSPAGMRPMSPGPGPGQRSQSPGPRYQQGRPQSPSGGAQRRMTPPGQSPVGQEYHPGPPTGPVGRKPVPQGSPVAPSELQA